MILKVNENMLARYEDLGVEGASFNPLDSLINAMNVYNPMNVFSVPRSEMLFIIGFE